MSRIAPTGNSQWRRCAGAGVFGGAVTAGPAFGGGRLGSNVWHQDSLPAAPHQAGDREAPLAHAARRGILVPEPVTPASARRTQTSPMAITSPPPDEAETRSGTTADILKQAFLENLYYAQAKFPAVATRNDLYMAMAYTVRDRVVRRAVAT